MACSTVKPVPRAFERSAVSVPSPTQNVWGRSPATATPMATPRPRPMRRAFWNSTESGRRCAPMVETTRAGTEGPADAENIAERPAPSSCWRRSASVASITDSAT